MMTALDKATEWLDQAALLRLAGNLAEAESCLKRALEALYAEGCPDQVVCANVMNALASILEQQGRFHEAAGYARKAMEGAGHAPSQSGSRASQLTVLDTLRLASGLGREMRVAC